MCIRDSYTTGSTQISQLLRTLREQHHHMAVVVDEYEMCIRDRATSTVQPPAVPAALAPSTWWQATTCLLYTSRCV